MKPKKSLIILIIIIILIGCTLVIYSFKDMIFNKETPLKDEFIINGKSVSEVEAYAKKNDYLLKKEYVYDKIIKENIVISSTKNKTTIFIVISKGRIPLFVYQENNVNELGNVPIMMYHGIINTTSNKYTGGNDDKDGYNRTVKAFKEDLEYYYQNGYRMVRLIDYINGKISTEFGKSPIILTFDDGREDNFKVLGKDDNNDLIIDPNCAIGVLEEFKKKYKDFNVTATFFLNSGLFRQKEYNEDIIKWLIDHGYDIGNHTTNHSDFTKVTNAQASEIVGKMYKILDDIVSDKYVPIVALPYGSPYKKDHSTFKYILDANYGGKNYKTISTLRVGWEPELSPYHKNFDETFLKRCRAYDNNGIDFDIKMVFDSLKSSKYISDGDTDTIVIKESNSINLIDNTNKEIIKY